MFDRNRVDNIPEQTVPVEIAFADGRRPRARCSSRRRGPLSMQRTARAASSSSSLTAVRESYLAKAQLASVRLVGVPKAPNLEARLVDHDGFDPHRILGLQAGAGREEVRAAYFALAKAYHPTATPPPRCPRRCAPLAAMARRINAAHAALEAPQKRQAARAEPIFTWAGR